VIPHQFLREQPCEVERLQPLMNLLVIGRHNFPLLSL
jgi:hypothetical protein